jgi:hypothetical protein
MPLATLDYAPPAECVTGRFVARYLQVLAWFSIASTVAAPILFHSLDIDLSPILLFWAAHALKRRSRAARRWVLAIAGLVLVLVAFSFVRAIVAGTAGITVWLGTRKVSDPALWQLAAIVVPLAALAIVPLAVLMSERARREFGCTQQDGNRGGS